MAYTLCWSHVGFFSLADTISDDVLECDEVRAPWPNFLATDFDEPSPSLAHPSCWYHVDFFSLAGTNSELYDLIDFF